MKLRFLSVLLVLGTGPLPPAVADAADSNPEPVRQETPKAYTDGGGSYLHTPSSGSFYNPNFFHDRHFSPGFHGNGWMQPLLPLRVQYRPIYYPPNPPALGQASFLTRTGAASGRSAPPLGLDSHVYENFYAPLSVLLYTEDLSHRRLARLDAYVAARGGLLAEIRAKLAALADADPATRESELAALAQAQAPRLDALAAEAEEIRDNLVTGSLFHLESGSDWNDTRRWHLGDDTRWESHADEIKVMRGYAAYEEGLSAQQRHLLREIAMELADSLAAPAAEITLSSPGPYFYFSPETARITLPAGLPDALAEKVDAYRTLKAGLKKELRDTLYAYDRAFLTGRRTAALTALATAQAPRFAELERLAEEIRRGLAPLPNPARPPVLALPTELRARVDEYNRRKAALQTAILAKIEEIKADFPNDRVEFSRVGDSYNVALVPYRRSTAAQKAKRAELVPALAAFNREQAGKFVALAREKQVLAEAINATARHYPQDAALSLNLLLQAFSPALQKQETWELYREYETAVLQPGLSPAQRRILFGAALDTLNLPLAN